MIRALRVTASDFRFKRQLFKRPACFEKTATLARDTNYERSTGLLRAGRRRLHVKTYSKRLPPPPPRTPWPRVTIRVVFGFPRLPTGILPGPGEKNVFARVPFAQRRLQSLSPGATGLDQDRGRGAVVLRVSVHQRPERVQLDPVLFGTPLRRTSSQWRRRRRWEFDRHHRHAGPAGPFRGSRQPERADLQPRVQSQLDQLHLFE